MRKVLPIGACFAGAGCLLIASLATGDDPERDPRPRPQYTKEGALQVPAGFRSWVTVGTDLSIRYKSDEPAAESIKARAKPTTEHVKREDTFHAVYINPDSYEAFRRTGKFPDPTVLVMEVFSAMERDPAGVVAGGRYQGKRIAVEAAVKDSKRPGGGVPWAYYDFPLDRSGKPARQAKARPDGDCFQCHLRHASIDNVWVQFYPALRDPE